MQPKQELTITKPGLHPRNKHVGRYNFDVLIATTPSLAHFVKRNAYDDLSIDFADALAVKTLNRALLLHYYAVADWDIPPNYLCPPIPGRADYLHYLADLLGASNDGPIPHGSCVRVLDIGTGANVIYPLIGHREYGWHFVGADIDAAALGNAQGILDANAGLADAITLRKQASAGHVFKTLIRKDEIFDLTMCNPPFHASLNEAIAGTARKWRGLERSRNQTNKPIKHSTAANTLNFGGQAAELYCAGGEAAFIELMVNESTQFAKQCLWFTTLVSKAANLPGVYRALKKIGALETQTINMTQGQKTSRIVAWSFQAKTQQLAWARQRWHNR